MMEPWPLIVCTAFDLVALEVLIGGLACRLWVLPAAHEALFLRQARRLNRLCLVCLTVLTATTIVLLIVTARDMSGSTYAGLPPVLMTVLSRTHYGHFWIARAMVIVALWLMMTNAPRRGQRKWLFGVLILAAVFAFLRSATGHAADTGTWSVHVASDWLHILLTALWAGGVIATAVAVSALYPASGSSCEALARQGRRISQLATAALLGVLITGILNAWYSLSAPGQLVITDYGEWLVLKLVMVAVMVLLGATNRFCNLKKLDEPRRATGFMRILNTEAMVAVIVLVVAACLINTSPPHPAIP